MSKLIEYTLFDSISCFILLNTGIRFLKICLNKDKVSSSNNTESYNVPSWKIGASWKAIDCIYCDPVMTQQALANLSPCQSHTLTCLLITLWFHADHKNFCTISPSFKAQLDFSLLPCLLSTMETPIPCSAEEEHIFRSQHPAVPVPDITLNDFVLQDAELYADKVAFVEAVTGKTYICRGC